MDSDFFSGGIPTAPITPTPPPPAEDYGAPAGVPTADSALAPQQAPQPGQPVEQPQPEAERPRDGSGRWMSQAEWDARMRGEDVPAPPQPVAAQPEPAPAPEQPNPYAIPQVDERARQIEADRLALERQRAEFETQRAQIETQQAITRFKADWDGGRERLRQQVQAMPVEQAIAAVERYDRAERDAYLKFQGEHLTQREQAAQTRYQEIAQREHQRELSGHYPGFARQVAQLAGIGDLTPDEVNECIAVADQYGNPDAIATHIQTAIAPRRQMQQRLDQLQRSQQVQTLANAGVYAVSGGTGNPAGASRAPREGRTLAQATADWYA